MRGSGVLQSLRKSSHAYAQSSRDALAVILLREVLHHAGQQGPQHHQIGKEQLQRSQDPSALQIRKTERDRTLPQRPILPHRGNKQTIRVHLNPPCQLLRTLQPHHLRNHRLLQTDRRHPLNPEIHELQRDPQPPRGC